MPALPLEAAIAIGVRTLLSDQAAIVRAAEAAGLESNDLLDVLLAAKMQLDKLESLGDFQARKDALTLVKKAELQSDGINLTIRLLVTASGHPQQIEILGHILMKLKRRGVEMRLVLQGGAAPERKPDEILIKSIGRGCQWFEELTTGQSKSATEIAGREGVTDRYVAHLMQLAFLSPDIVTSIVEGTQPAELSATKLIHELDLDPDWSRQRASLGFHA